jgi:hypothetical protein
MEMVKSVMLNTKSYVVIIENNLIGETIPLHQAIKDYPVGM